MGIDQQPAINHCTCDWCGDKADYTVEHPIGGRTIPDGWQNLYFRAALGELVCPVCYETVNVVVGQLRSARQRSSQAK